MKTEATTTTEKNSAYLKILRKTQGTWVKEDWGSLRKKRRKIEFATSEKRKRT